MYKRQLSRVIHILSDKEEKSPIDFLYQWNENFAEKVLKDENFWLTAEQEYSCLKFLDERYNVQEIVFNVGKEFFLTDCFNILPTDDSLLNYYQILFRVPIILQRYVRYFTFEITDKGENYVLLRVIDFNKSSLYDLLFMKGMLESSAILYRVVGWKMELLETRLKNVSSKLSEDIQNVKFDSTSTIFRVSWKSSELEIGKTNLKQKQSSFETETFVISKTDSSSKDFGKITYINLDAIVQKSRELYLENRDLEAAVEVLSSFRNDLMSKQKAISKDLKMARNIQRGIIPQHIPDWKGLQFSFSFLPMQEVSGDYYDYFQFGSNKIGIMLSDVSGHGVPAAFITAISKLLFTNYKLDSPAEIFVNVNRELIDLVKQQGYLTCFYGVIDSDYKMTYCIAGHPRPILLRYATGEIEILEGEGTFLGMFEDAHELYKDNSIQLEPGDKLFIYTDGLLEGQSDEGIPFQQENLIHCIKQT
ncbi:MAG: serine/threonine-protein phosphatase, partial [Leptospiraceae bacterium]|nr:serine/threonine-protein phosphatase [Leptospiraceae bacterium]